MLLNRPKRCIHNQPMLCNKRGCPVHDPRMKLASANLGLPIKGTNKPTNGTFEAPVAPPSRAARSSAEILTKPSRIVKSARASLTKPACASKSIGAGKMRPPKASQPRAKVEQENNSSSILKPSKIAEPAVAAEVAKARSPSTPTPAPVVPQPAQSIEKPAFVSDPASLASDKSTAESITVSTSTVSPSSPSRGSPSTGSRKTPSQYGDPGVAVPKGIKKRRNPPKPRAPSLKQRVARFIQD
jgi:hypothetical protein